MRYKRVFDETYIRYINEYTIQKRKTHPCYFFGDISEKAFLAQLNTLVTIVRRQGVNQLNDFPENLEPDDDAFRNILVDINTWAGYAAQAAKAWPKDDEVAKALQKDARDRRACVRYYRKWLATHNIHDLY